MAEPFAIQGEFNGIVYNRLASNLSPVAIGCWPASGGNGATPSPYLSTSRPAGCPPADWPALKEKARRGFSGGIYWKYEGNVNESGARSAPGDFFSIVIQTH